MAAQERDQKPRGYRLSLTCTNSVSGCTGSGCTASTRRLTEMKSTAWSPRGWPSPRTTVACACPQGNNIVTSVESALRKAVADLNAVKALWALVGGLAVSARTVPRFTRDLDFAVAVADDGEAEDMVRRLHARDYAPVEVLEQDSQRDQRQPQRPGAHVHR